MPDIPVVTDMRLLPMYYRAFGSMDLEPSAEHAELARKGYRDVYRKEPGAVSFYCAPDLKLRFYVVEDQESEE